MVLKIRTYIVVNNKMFEKENISEIFVVLLKYKQNSFRILKLHSKENLFRLIENHKSFHDICRLNTILKSIQFFCKATESQMLFSMCELS